MTTNFPTSLDSFTNPTPADNLDTPAVLHTDQHDNINDAVRAVEVKLGINNSAVTSTIDYLLKNTSSIDPGHKHSVSSLTGLVTDNYIAVIGLGDSIMAQNTLIAGANYRFPNGQVNVANQLMGNRLIWNATLNRGANGNTTQGVLLDATNITTTVNTYNVRAAIIQVGINDVLGAVPTATIISRYTQIFDLLLRTLNLDVFAFPILPRTGLTPTQQTSVTDVNTFLQSYCNANSRAEFIDVYNSFNASTDTLDGTHPNIAGANILGTSLASYMVPYYSQGSWNHNAINILPNEPFTGNQGLNGTTNLVVTGSIPNGWYLAGPDIATASVNFSQNADGSTRVTFSSTNDTSSSTLFLLLSATGAYSHADSVQGQLDTAIISASNAKTLAIMLFDNANTDYSVWGNAQLSVSGFQPLGRGIIATDNYNPDSTSTDLQLQLKAVVDADSKTGSITFDVYNIGIIKGANGGGPVNSIIAGSGVTVNSSDPANPIIATTGSVSNSDGTLTISPTTGAVVASLNLGHANTWTGQQTFNTSAAIFGVGAITPKIYPSANSTTAVQMLKADGTTAVLTMDTTNSRIGIGTASPQATLDVNGIISSPDSGTRSERFGLSSSATGVDSFAAGNGASATGQLAVAVGRSASASTLEGTAVGASSTAGFQGTSIGYGTSTGTDSLAMGFNAAAAAASAVAIGALTVASGSNSFAMGTSASATQTGSIAVGQSASSTANYAHSYGFGAANTTANTAVIGGVTGPVTTLFLGSSDFSTAPPNVIYTVSKASGSNVAGGSITIAGGAATGNAAGGSILFQTSTVGSTGTTLQTQKTWATLDNAGLLTLADAFNIAINTTTGSQIGTGATQKIGKWGATPVVQSTGWSVTNVTTTKTFDANSTSLDEIADVLGTMMNTFKTYGELGA